MAEKTDREILIEYLLMMVRRQDWHAVRDAAVDIEIMDAEKRGNG